VLHRWARWHRLLPAAKLVWKELSGKDFTVSLGKHTSSKLLFFFFKVREGDWSPREVVI
jgi:hypothetical protein